MRPAPESTPVQAHVFVLLVEGEVVLRAVLAGQMRTAGLTVIEAANADDALTYLDLGGHADLVFSDLDMPGSMNGMDLAERIHDRDAGIPIILTSGRAWPQDQRGVVAAFVPKPYDVPWAIAIVLATLGRSRPDSGDMIC
jgi:CheY-like chemotaxis protein